MITQASAHSAPTLGNEFKFVNWLRAAAIIAQIDPVANGYLVQDEADSCVCRRSPRSGAGVNLPANGQTNLLIEYQIHNLSDADFVNSIPDVAEVQVIVQQIGPSFGYYPSDTARFNNFFRNVVLSLGPERLMMIYSNQGLEGVVEGVCKLRQLHVI